SPGGELLGTVSLYGYGCIAHPRALELAVHAASMVEERLAEDDHRHRSDVFAHYARHLSRYPDDPAIGLDRQGKVLALSSAAAALLGVLTEEAAGRTLSALPGIALDA